MVEKFKKIPVIIEAIQFNGNSNKSEIETFVGKELKLELESETAFLAGKAPPIFSLLIETKEGTMRAFKGDWIIKEPFPTGYRDFYPCKNEIFTKTYVKEAGDKTKVDYRACSGNWIPFDHMNLNTRPKDYGKYLICRKDGKIHWETWNGSGWAYNHNEVRFYAEIIPPKN